MKSVTIIIVIAMIWCSSEYSEAKGTTDTSGSYGAVYFNKRCPTVFGLFKNRKRYQIEQTASIPISNSDTKVDLFWGRDSLGSQDFTMVVQYPNKSFTTSQLVFKKSGFDQLSTITRVRISSSENDPPSKLELRVLTHNGILLFKWLDSKAENEQLGGVPLIKTVAISVGKSLPLIIANSLGHKSTHINKIKGRILVINWWSIGCLPCREEIQGFNKLVDKYRKSSVDFIAIAWNNESEILQFLKDNRFEFKHFVHDQVIDSLFGNAFPRNIIVDRRGTVVYDNTGGSKDTYLNLQECIERELSKKE